MPRFRVKVIEFSDNVEGSSGEIIARQLATREGIEVGYFDEPFNKSFLNLESRTLFDLIDKGQTILDKTGADVLLWGCREGSRIRLNFQVPSQYEDEELAFVSLMDSLYIPARPESENYPDAVINLIYGGLLSSLNAAGAQAKVYKRYLLKKIIDRLSKDNSAKTLSIEYMPYIMNFLGIIYLSYAFDKSDGRDFKIVKSLFDTAIKHQDLITSPIHLGCIYNHLGQLYDCATRYMDKNPAAYFKGAIEYYRLAQKYLSKYTYPYDYGYISYKLSKLFFNYWRQKEDIQAAPRCRLPTPRSRKNLYLCVVSRILGRNSGTARLSALAAGFVYQKRGHLRTGYRQLQEPPKSHYRTPRSSALGRMFGKHRRHLLSHWQKQGRPRRS